MIGLNLKCFVCLFTLVNSFNVLVYCFEIEIVTQPHLVIESPVWSCQENALYWVNALGQTVFRMDRETGEITTRHIRHGPTLAITLVQDYPGYLVVAVRTKLFLLKWGAPGADKALRLLTVVDRSKPDNAIDYLKADTVGRLWIGTMGKFIISLPTVVEPDQAKVYSIDTYNFITPAVKKAPVSLSKGMVWSFDDTILYYADSLTRKVSAFDYNIENGILGNETVIFSFDDYDIAGMPDGMTLDVDENIWIATYNTKILKINPRTGELLQVLQLPVDQITSLTWGGPLLDELYVTTAAVNVLHPQPMSGTLLKITGLNTSGIPDSLFVFPKAPNY